MAEFVHGMVVGFVLATVFWAMVDILYETLQEAKHLANRK